MAKKLGNGYQPEATDEEPIPPQGDPEVEDINQEYLEALKEKNRIAESEVKAYEGMLQDTVENKESKKKEHAEFIEVQGRIAKAQERIAGALETIAENLRPHQWNAGPKP